MPSRHTKEVSQLDRGRVLALHNEEKSYRFIADHTGIPKSTAYDIVANYNKYGSATPQPRSGRPPLLSSQTQRSIAQYLRLYPFESYNAIAELDGTVTLEQVRYAAKKLGLQRYVARQQPYLTPQMMEARRKWVQDNLNRNWDWVAWADKTTLSTGDQPVRPKVTRKKGEAFLPKYMVPTFRSGRESLGLWGCVAHGKKGPLIWLKLAPCVVGKGGRSKGGGLTSAAYAEQVIEDPLKDFLANLEVERGHKILIVEDGAASHRGAPARRAREALGIEQLPHPSSSPDLNAIEPIWRLLKSRVFKIPGSRRNLNNLWKAAQKVWDEMTVEEINKHTGKMDAQVKAVDEANGGPTEF
ncbi:hypothetical protein ACGC1H_005451 [Rhizoctonia solani]